VSRRWRHISHALKKAAARGQAALTRNRRLQALVEDARRDLVYADRVGAALRCFAMAFVGGRLEGRPTPPCHRRQSEPMGFPT
jgi:hypothetical protein